jgi:hypothetical protein
VLCARGGVFIYIDIILEATVLNRLASDHIAGQPSSSPPLSLSQPLSQPPPALSLSQPPPSLPISFLLPLTSSPPLVLSVSRTQGVTLAGAQGFTVAGAQGLTLTSTQGLALAIAGSCQVTTPLTIAISCQRLAVVVVSVISFYWLFVSLKRVLVRCTDF